MKRKPGPLSPLNGVGPVRRAKRLEVSPGDEESLISLIARTSSTNFLSLKDFMVEVIAPLLGPEGALGVLDWDSFSSVVGPNVQADRAVAAMNSATGCNDHAHYTFKPYEKLWGNRSLKLRKARVWCPDCYLDDIQTGKPPYDRLSWTVAAVTVCSRHQKLLHNKCLTCGVRDERFHLSGYQPGICGYCGTWLNPLTPGANDPMCSGSFSSWKSSAINQMIACRSNLYEFDNRNIAPCLKRILAKLFANNQSTFANYLQLSKGYICDCVSARITPSMDALLLISYISQTPLIDIYTGAVVEEFMQIMPVPDSDSRRRAPYSKLTPDVRLRVMNVLTRIESPHDLTHVFSWDAAAKAARVSRDTIRAVAGARKSSLAAIFKKRRLNDAKWKDEYRTRMIHEAINAAFTLFTEEHRRVSRRAVFAHVASAGVPIDHRRHGWVYGKVLAERGKVPRINLPSVTGDLSVAAAEKTCEVE